jgi:hypothetical protein
MPRCGTSRGTIKGTVLFRKRCPTIEYNNPANQWSTSVPLEFASSIVACRSRPDVSLPPLSRRRHAATGAIGVRWKGDSAEWRRWR